jgi:TP901 family phage tail tape measure protein
MALTDEMRLAIKLTATQTTNTAFSQLHRNLDGLKRAAIAVGGAIVGALAFRDVIDTTRRLGDEIDMLRDEIGLTASEASQLLVVLRTYGVDATTASRAFGNLTNEVIKAATATDESKSAFAKYGITIRDTTGTVFAFENILQNVRRRLQELPAGFARSNAAMEIFGERVGRKLLDFLVADDAAIKEITDDMREWGLILE